MPRRRRGSRKFAPFAKIRVKDFGVPAGTGGFEVSGRNGCKPQAAGYWLLATSLKLLNALRLAPPTPRHGAATGSGFKVSGSKFKVLYENGGRFFSFFLTCSVQIAAYGLQLKEALLKKVTVQ